MLMHSHKQMCCQIYVKHFVVAVSHCAPVCSSLNPLFPGTNELDQVAKIHNVLGTPDQSTLVKFKQ